MKKGMDISYYQGNVDFSLVKANGTEFVIIREGYRNTTDPKFFEYVQQAKAAGLIIVGVYHFSYALNEGQAKEEAQFCIKNMEKAGLGTDTLVFYDFEYDTVEKASANGVLLNRSECNAHTLAFCEEVKRFGYTPGIYTNLDYYKNWYDKSVLAKYYIWLADYSGGPDFDCLIQQYTSAGSVPGIKGNVDLDYYYEENFKMGELLMRSRSEVVKLATSWIGKNEADGSYKEIIDIYNSFAGPFPRGVRMLYTWPWCACTWSALAIKLGYTDIMPIEISCGELIERAKAMGCWEENDAYVPRPGDAILYDWNDNGVGDNTGWPDHVGVVDYVNEKSGYMTVIEGNYSNSVKKRTISLNGRYIRGFITPKYTDDSIVYESGTSSTTKDVATVAREVITGLWGNGTQRKEALEKAGYNYAEVQTKVNEILNGDADKAASTPEPSTSTTETSKKVEATCYAKSKNASLAGTYTTTANLYCRNDAGSNKKALCLIPKGTQVKNYGFYTIFNGVKWLLIQFTLDGVQYTGFSSSSYLKK